MITDEDRAAPGIDMHCVSDRIDELVNGRRRLTVTLEGEYDDEATKDNVLEQLKHDVRMYSGDFRGAVIEAMRASYARLQQELATTQRELRQERDLREQAETALEGQNSLLADFGKALKTPATTP